MSPSYTPLFLIASGAIVALLAVRGVQRIPRRRLGQLGLPPARRAALRTRVERFTRALTYLMVGLVGIAALSIVVDRLNLDEPRWRVRDVVHNLMTHGVYI